MSRSSDCSSLTLLDMRAMLFHLYKGGVIPRPLPPPLCTVSRRERSSEGIYRPLTAHPLTSFLRLRFYERTNEHRRAICLFAVPIYSSRQLCTQPVHLFFPRQPITLIRLNGTIYNNLIIYARNISFFILYPFVYFFSFNRHIHPLTRYYYNIKLQLRNVTL